MNTTDIAHDLDKTIIWRREKVERHPEDVRNQTAIEICERLKGQAASAAASARLAELEQQYLDLAAGFETYDEDLPVNHDETYRSIGFSFHPKHVDELVASLSRDYEAAIGRLRDLAANS